MGNLKSRFWLSERIRLTMARERQGEEFMRNMAYFVDNVREESGRRKISPGDFVALRDHAEKTVGRLLDRAIQDGGLPERDRARFRCDLLDFIGFAAALGHEYLRLVEGKGKGVT